MRPDIARARCAKELKVRRSITGASPARAHSRRVWRQIRAIVGAAMLGVLMACGGGGGSTAPSTPQRLVGEIFASPAELATSELRFTAGYTGDRAASRALAAAGKVNLIDALFLFHPDGQAAQATPVADAAAQLDRFARDHADLLPAGTRVLILDELFWQPGVPSADALSPTALAQRQDGLRRAIDLVRARLPQVRIGITVTPYLVIGAAPADAARAHAALATALAGVDWVATDPYWFGQPDLVDALVAWSRDFHAFAKTANPAVETWFVAQAFRDPAWDEGRFRTLMAQQLAHAERYDHVIFYGWQGAPGLDPAAQGRHFQGATRALYAPYMVTP